VNILMVSEDLPGERIGGLGKHVVTLANALLARGHEVAILGRNDTGAADGAAQIGFGGRFIGGFDYRHPGWKELQLGAFNPLKRPWFARKIGRAIALHAQRFDVVHYHGHLPMVGLHVERALYFVQSRHDQGSECLTHLRWRTTRCTSTAARDRRLRRAAPGPAAPGAHGAGGRRLPPPGRRRPGPPQDHFRVRFPAPPVPARAARCRPVALPGDPQFRRRRAFGASWRRSSRALIPAASCWPGASMPARASANSCAKRRAACRPA
jgi:hypothetical protein